VANPDLKCGYHDRQKDAAWVECFANEIRVNVKALFSIDSSNFESSPIFANELPEFCGR
jgi:hypothetical protein